MKYSPFFVNFNAFSLMIAYEDNTGVRGEDG